MDNQPADISSKPIPEEVYLEWTSPSRIYKQRNREFYTNIAAIVFLTHRHHRICPGIYADISGLVDCIFYICYLHRTAGRCET